MQQTFMFTNLDFLQLPKVPPFMDKHLQNHITNTNSSYLKKKKKIVH